MPSFNFCSSQFFERVDLQRAVDQIEMPPSFLEDTFFPRKRFTSADLIAYDIKNGTQTLAPYINPRIGNKVVERAGYRTNIIRLPEIAPSMILTPDDAKKRLFGESFFNDRSLVDRLRDLQAEDIVDMMNMHRRRREQQNASLILTGKVIIKGEGIDDEMDVWGDLQPADRPYTDVGVINADNYWTGSSADPAGDLIAARQRAARYGGRSPNVAVMGAGAFAAFRANQEWRESLDNAGINAGYIDVQYLPDGVARVGYYAEAGLTLYVYDREIYNEETEQMEQIIPSNIVLVGSTRADTERVFGEVAMTRPDRGWDFRNGEFNVNSYMQISPEQGMLTEVKAKTIPVIKQIQEFQVLKVLAGA